jgi:hypothetical protein
LLDEWVICALCFTAYGVLEYVIVSALKSPQPQSARLAALAGAIEMFSRVFATIAWLITTCLFFVDRPGSTVAIVLLNAILFAIAVVVARRFYVRALESKDPPAIPVPPPLSEPMPASSSSEVPSVRARRAKRRVSRKNSESSPVQ